MRVGSLFAGIGGFDLGFQRAGFEIAWQVEIDPFCQTVLAKHWPDVKRYDDIRKCGSHNLERVDVVCGGFPCQPVSLCGLRKVQSDKRWLWPEFARIICELRPGYAVMENVPGLLVHGIEDVLGDLAEVGYDAEWACLRASDVGAPHRRERVFIVAYPSVGGWSGVLCDLAGLSGAPHPSWGASTALDSPVDSARHIESWLGQPAILGSAHGLPGKLGERQLGAIGNAVVPQLAEFIARRIRAHAEAV